MYSISSSSPSCIHRKSTSYPLHSHQHPTHKRTPPHLSLTALSNSHSHSPSLYVDPFGYAEAQQGIVKKNLQSCPLPSGWVRARFINPPQRIMAWVRTLKSWPLSHTHTHTHTHSARSHSPAVSAAVVLLLTSYSILLTHYSQYSLITQSILLCHHHQICKVSSMSNTK